MSTELGGSAFYKTLVERRQRVHDRSRVGRNGVHVEHVGAGWAVARILPRGGIDRRRAADHRLRHCRSTSACSAAWRNDAPRQRAIFASSQDPFETFNNDLFRGRGAAAQAGRCELPAVGRSWAARVRDQRPARQRRRGQCRSSCSVWPPLVEAGDGPPSQRVCSPTSAMARRRSWRSPTQRRRREASAAPRCRMPAQGSSSAVGCTTATCTCVSMRRCS